MHYNYSTEFFCVNYYFDAGLSYFSLLQPYFSIPLRTSGAFSSAAGTVLLQHPSQDLRRLFQRRGDSGGF